MRPWDECGVWVRGCSEWMLAKSKRGWKAYYIEFLFHCPTMQATVSQIHDWIKVQFYLPFCEEFVSNPKCFANNPGSKAVC